MMAAKHWDPGWTKARETIIGMAQEYGYRLEFFDKDEPSKNTSNVWVVFHKLRKRRKKKARLHYMATFESKEAAELAIQDDWDRNCDLFEGFVEYEVKEERVRK